MNAVTSTTAAKMKALREAKKLGCSGAHQTGDGVWRPCSSAESLAKIVPSSPSAIGPISAPRRQQRGNNNMQRQWENLGSRGIVAIDTLSGGGLVSGVVGKQYQPAAPRDEDPDVFTDIEAARDRSRQLGCIGVSRRISRSGRTIWMPCTNMTDLANRTGRTALGRRNMQKRTERFIADVVKRNQPRAMRSRKKSLYDDLHGSNQINTKGIGPKIGKRIGRGLRAAPSGFVFIDVTGAIDADKDGIVFEGLPLERPIIPRFIIPEGTARRVQNLIGTTALANEQNRRSGLSPDGAIDKNVLSQIIGVTPNDVPTEREDALLSKLRNVLGSGRKPSTYAQSAVMEDRRLDFGDPDLEISRSSERIGKRETAGLMKALDAVDDEYEFLSASELEELVTRLVPGSNEELMEALKSSPYTRKNAKRIYERITAAEPDYEATLLARKILQDELMRTPGVRNAIRQYGMPPIVVTGYEPDIDNMGFIDLTSGPRMWQSIIGGYAPSGFIAFNSGVFPDPRTGRVRDAMFKGEDLDSLIRHELAHAWQFMAAKQGGPARDYLVSLYSELHENLQQGRGNPASKNYSEALYRSVTWGSEQERASARKISEYAETARIEWFAESFAAITDDDPSRRMRVDNTSIANMANVLGMSVNEFMGFIGERNRPQLSERARSSSTRSVSNLLLGPMSKPEQEAHNWLLENPSYVADSPDAMLLRLPPDTVDAFIRNQRLSTRSRYNTDISKAQAKADEARRNGELGQKVLDSLFARATGENSSSRPTMWFVGGTTGSGKSTLRTNGVLSGVPNADTAVDIDPDVIKTMHPDWDGGRGASAVHGWSTQWALYGMRQATAQNRDYVVTGTGVRVDQMLIGRNNGYKVVGHYVHVPTPIAEQRMASRAQQGGVKLPTNFASQYASELQYKVRKAITNGYMDEFFLWDNSQDEGNATLAVVRREDGTFDILNRRVFEEFFGKDGARAVEKHWESQRAEATTGTILPSTRSSSSGAGSFTNPNWPKRFSIQKPQTIYRKHLTGKRTSNSELFGVTFGSDVDLSDHQWMSAQLVNVKAENLKTSQPVVFRNSTLKAVSFKNTIIPPGSDMHRAILERVSFDGSEIIGVDFSETSMRGVDFSKSRVGNINLTGAILERVEFDIADLSDSGLTTKQLRGSGIIWTDRTKFSPEIQQFIDSLPKDQIVNQNGKYSFVVNNTSTTPMSKADLEYAKSLRFILGSRVIDIPAFTSDDKTISGLDGTRGTISNPGWASLRDGKITKSYMDLFSAINQNIADVKITDSLMGGSRFTGSNLQDVSFSGSLLRGASFRGVKIRGTLDLRRTDLQGADFAGAKFDTEALRNSNIDLRGANLTDAYLGELPLGKLKLDHAILSGAQWNGPDSEIDDDLRKRGLRGTRSMSRSTSHGAAMQLNDLSERLASPTRLSRREKTELIQDMSSMYRELIDSRLERPERQEFADFIESLKDTAFKDLERFRVPSIPNRPMLLIESARANDKKSFVERFKKVRETEPNFMRSRSAIQAWEEANSIARKSDELDALHIQAIDDLREERVIAQSLPQLQNILHGDFLDANNRKRPTGNFPSGKRAKENIIAGTESTRSRRIDANKPLPISEISPNLSDDFPRVTGNNLGGLPYDSDKRRFNSSLAKALRRAIGRIAGNGNGRRSDELGATKKTTKRIIADVLKDDLSKLLDGTYSRKPVREALTDDRDRLLDSLRIIFDTREEASAVNLPTMHAEPYEPFKSMVDPEVDWSSIYIPTQQDALDMFEEISALRIGSRPEYDEGYVPRHSEILERHSRRFVVNDDPLITEEELSDPSHSETFIGIYEMGMRAPYLYGVSHDGMHLAVGRGFDRHGEYAASLAEISYILQIPDMSDEDKNLVASALIDDVSRHFQYSQYSDVLIDVLPNYDTDMYDMRKVFDVMIRRSTYRDVGGNESNNSTRSMRSATDADVDAITQEYLNSERFPRRLSAVYGIDIEELTDEEVRIIAEQNGLPEKDLDILYRAILSVRNFLRKNKGEQFSYAPGLGEETAKRMRDSIRVEVAPNGVPMVIAEPFEDIVGEIPDKRDWSKVLAPSMTDIERVADAIREARNSGSPIPETLSEESREKVRKVAYSDDEDSPFNKIMKQIVEKLGSAQYPDIFSEGDDLWVGLYLRGLAMPERMAAGMGTDGIHDFFGHFGIGRGFDRHGEWAAALATDSLVRDHPAFDFLTPDEREYLRREFFLYGAGGVQRISQQLDTEHEQRFGISRHFSTTEYDSVSQSFISVEDTRTPEQLDAARAFDELDQLIREELVSGTETFSGRPYFSMDQILDLLGVPPTTTRSDKQSNSRVLTSTRSSRTSIPLAEASNKLLLSIASNEAAIKNERSTRSALFKTYKNRPMTDEERARFQPLNLGDDEKIKIESGVKLVFTNEYDEIKMTLIVGPQVARFRGTPGTKMYIDPNPPEQDFIDEMMAEWERKFGPPSDPRRRTSSNQTGGGGRRSSEPQRQSGNDEEDALDRINRLVDEDMARRGAQSTRSRTDTYLLAEQTQDEIVKNLELDVREAEIARRVLAGSSVPQDVLDLYYAEQRNRRYYIRQKIDDLEPDISIGETGKKIAESLSIRVSSNGIPVITSQPHPIFNSIIPDRRDWTYVEAPSADAVRNIIEQAQGFERDWDPGIDKLIGVARESLYKIVLDKLDEVGAGPEQTKYRTFTDFAPYLIDSLENPRRAVNNLDETDGIHDVIGHLGTGRGFDRHGEWANALAMVSVITDHPDIGLNADERDRVARWWLDIYGKNQLMNQLRTDAGDDLKKLISVNQSSTSNGILKAIYSWPGTVQDLIGSLTTQPASSLRSTRSSRIANAPNGVFNLAYLEQDVRRAQFMSNISATRSGRSTREMQRRQNPVTASNATRSIVSRRSTRSLSSTVPQLRISEDGSRAYMDASAKDAFLANPQAFIDSLTEADIPNGYFRKGERNKLDKYKQDLLALATLDSLVPNEDGYGVSARHLFAVDALDSSKANPPDIVKGDRRRNILATRRTEKIFHQADVASLKAGEALFVTDIPATGKMSAIDNGLMVRNTDGSLTLIEIDDEDELDAIEEFMDGANQRLNENGVAILSVDDIRASLASTKKVSSILQTLENYHTTIADIDPRIPRPNIIFKADYVLSKYPGIDSKRVAGTAYPDANSIVMWKTSDEMPYVDIMLHEFGHIADFALGFRVAIDDRDVSYSSDYSFSSLTDDWVPAMESDQAHGLLFGARNMSLRVIAGNTSFDVEADRGAAKQPTSVPGTNYRRIALAVDESHGPRIGNRFITRYAKESDSYQEDFAESTSLFLRDKMFGYATSVTDTNGEQRTYTFAELYPNRAAVLEKLFYPSTRSVSNFDSRFTSAYGARPIFGDGDCYEAASNMADRLRSPEFGYSDNQIRIVHGIPLGTGGEAMGVRYGHAWAEVAKGGWEKYEQLRNEIADVLREAETITSKSLKEGLARRHNKLMQELIRMEAEDMIVYDFSNGNEHVFPRYLYYKIGNIEDENTRYYSRRDADIKMVADEHYGPWE